MEPSAGTGLLAILAEVAGGALVLNELAEMRAALLSFLFPAISVTRFDAAQIDDHLDAAVVPTVVLMNPPFSVMAHVEGRVADATFRHVASALARLAPGGRLVTITGAGFSQDNTVWAPAFTCLQERGRVVFSAAIDGSVYAKHGTTFATRLTVIDKLPADDPSVFPDAPGVAPDVATLHGWLTEHLPARLPVDSSIAVPIAAPVAPRTVRGYLNRAAKLALAASPAAPDGVPLAYDTVEWKPTENGRLSDSIYEDYGLQTIRIAGAQAHPMLRNDAPVLTDYDTVGIGLNLDRASDGAGRDRVFVVVEAYQTGLGDRRRHRVEAVEPAGIGNELGALGFEHVPDRLIGQFRMAMRLGVSDAFVEQPGV